MPPWASSLQSNFFHFNKVRQVEAPMRAKSAVYDCLVDNTDSRENKNFLLHIKSFRSKVERDRSDPSNPIFFL